MSNNHVISPKYFYKAIASFAFDYDIYVVDHTRIDDAGNIVSVFAHSIINGSLQDQGQSLNQAFTGNTISQQYKFYCKSLYRINIGDFIQYKHKWLHCDEVQNYDEWGVREATLTTINLNDYKDFKEYLKYLQGDELV